MVTSPAARDALLATKDVLQVMAGPNAVRGQWSAEDRNSDRVRVALIQFYVEEDQAPTFHELALQVKLSEPSVRTLIEGLRRRDLAVLENERIVGAYPFTARDTGHQVTLDGRTVNATCAIDALGVGAMTGRDVAIVSNCRYCGSSIRVTTRKLGQNLALVKPDTTVVWQSVQYRGLCAANSLCTATAFLCSHLARWHANDPGRRLRGRRCD